MAFSSLKASMGPLKQRAGCIDNLAAIFFDLDNTLIPTRKGDAKACRKLIEQLEKQHGIPRDQGENITDTFLKSFRSCPDNPQTTLDSWRSYLWSQALPSNYRHLSDVIYKSWLQLRYRYLALTSEYENMLKKLSKFYLLALITNGPSNGQWEKVHKLNLSQYFDCILVSSDLPWEKPNPHIFLAACNLLNVKPQQCLMIGDKLETDIQGGKEANLGGTVWIPLSSDYDASSVKPKPDLVVKNLLELFNYLPVTASTSSSGRATTHNNALGMDDSDSEGFSAIRQRRQRSHSQSTLTAPYFSSRKASTSSSQYRRHVSFPAIDFNDSSCDCN